MGTTKVMQAGRAIDSRLKVPLYDGLVTVQPTEITLNNPPTATLLRVGVELGSSALIANSLDPEEYTEAVAMQLHFMRHAIAHELYSEVYQAINDLYPLIYQVGRHDYDLYRQINDRLSTLRQQLTP